MARLRKFVAYRRLERPYTRYSKFKRLSYVKSRPNVKIVRFDMGEKDKAFPVRVSLIAREGLQVRQEAIESARLTAIRFLEKKIGKYGYHYKILMYPFHILRENPIQTGAGADRLSTGMKLSFGKPIGLASQVWKGKEVMYIETTPDRVPLARTALKRATHKLPGTYSIIETRQE